jgi:dihydroflavonol-4-reductase
MEQLLITGGNGFLGSHLAEGLHQAGYRIKILARNRGSDTPAPEFETVWGDIRDEAVVDHAVRGVDRVIHTVSNFRKGGSDKDQAHGINVEGTKVILEAVHRHQVKQYVHCSTIGVHGSVLEIPATETTAFNPGDLYQQTKLEAEELVWEFTRHHRLTTTVIRPISLIGPGDTRMLKLFRMIKKGRFIKFGPCNAYFQPAYIDDVVEGFRLCLDNPKAFGEVFIIGGDEYVPLETLFTIIAEELQVKPPAIRIPLTPMLWAASLCETICVPLGIEPPLHRRRMSFFQNNRAFSIAKAKERLDYRPRINLRESIRRTIVWYEQEGWL